MDCVSCTGYAQNCNAYSRVKVGSDYSEEFEIGGRCPPGLCPWPLLFISVLDALSREFRMGLPSEMFLQMTFPHRNNCYRTVMVTVIVHHLSYVTVMKQLPTVMPMSAHRSNCYG